MAKILACRCIPLLIAVPIIISAAASPASALPGSDLAIEPPPGPDGIHVIDGSCVMNVGQLHVNITNFGLIGSKFSAISTYADAPSAQWPGGSGDEYLWAAGLWVGGRIGGEARVSTGQFEQEFRPEADVEYTVYEAREGRIRRPRGAAEASGRRFPDSGGDDDGDGLEDEEILDGLDNDGDGSIDEDFGQIGEQMMSCVMTDNTLLSQEFYAEHRPLNVSVVQTSYGWSQDRARDFVALEYRITNIGATPIRDMYVGMYVDCDIGRRNGSNIGSDDMAGFWEGMARCQDGLYMPVHVGYMYDAAARDPLPGCFGVCLLDHTSSLIDENLPDRAGVNSYNCFTGYQSYHQGGDPTNDDERYHLMSTRHIDPSGDSGDVNDHRFLISSGPFLVIEPGEEVRVVYALVIGDGFQGMLDTCAEAARIWFGDRFDRSGRAFSGLMGRESKVCLGDFPVYPNGESYLYYMNRWMMDGSCVNTGMPRIRKTEMFWDQERQDHCIYVNLDNCDECARRKGAPCTPSDFYKYWNCSAWGLSAEERAGCTGIEGREETVNWLLDMPPEPPGMRIQPADDCIHVYWNDKSEHSLDSRYHNEDFESYRIWRSDGWNRPSGSSVENGPNSDSWQLIGEFDKVSEFIKERIVGVDSLLVETLPLGRNTGLDTIAYTPRVMLDPRFDGLKEAMADFVVENGCESEHLPDIYGLEGALDPEAKVLEPWAAYPSALDTFYMATYRPADPKRGLASKDSLRFYEYIDRDVHNGFVYFYSVTATDYRQRLTENGTDIMGPGLTGHPSSSFIDATPSSPAKQPDEYVGESDEVYVFPNPATRESLAEFQQMQPNSEDPTGVRVRFCNLPASLNTIRIYTLDGDLVQELRHDGTGGYGEASWNLLSRNGQQVVSGIYLFTVEARDSRFERQIGKFAIIR